MEHDNPVRTYFSVANATKGVRKVLLVSNATMKGEGFLGHTIDALVGHFKGIKKLCFIACAQADPDAYTNKVRGIFAPYGIEVEGIHEPLREDRPQSMKEVLLQCEAVLVGPGNVHLLQKAIFSLNRILGARIWAGMPFAAIGSGCVCAGLSIQATTDMPVVLVPSLRGSGLVPFNIFIDYRDPSPTDTSNKQTDADMIASYQDYSLTPVFALREGAFLRVTGDSCVLGGSSAGGRLFIRNTEPIEYAKGADLSFLILQNLANNLEFKANLEDKATESAEKLARTALATKRKAMASDSGQRMTKSLDEGAAVIAKAGSSIANFSSNLFRKIKNDMSGASSYPPDDDNEDLM